MRGVHHALPAGAASFCECSEPKEPDAEACERCLLLDGDSYGNRVIEALRSFDGWATKAALVVETGRSTRTVERQLDRLLAAGRVVRRYIPLGDKTVAAYALVIP